MAIRRQKRPNPALDMTPMIDCVFQLLIFFMLSSSVSSPQMRIDLPEATTKDATDAEAVVIGANARGELTLNREVVPLADLVQRLRPLLERSKSKVVTFHGDQSLPYDVFLKTLDASRQAGALHLNVAHK